MDPWRPKYKPLYDAIERAIICLELAAMMVVFLIVVILTL